MSTPSFASVNNVRFSVLLVFRRVRVEFECGDIFNSCSGAERRVTFRIGSRVAFMGSNLLPMKIYGRLHPRNDTNTYSFK